MLRVVATEPSLLSADLLLQLKSSIRSGVERGSRDAKKCFVHILSLASGAQFKAARLQITSGAVHAESIGKRILRQMDASNQ
jgi:hypothetical protein